MTGRGRKKKQRAKNPLARRGIIFGRAARAQAAQPNANSQGGAAPQPDTAEIVKALLALARERGRLTHEEINDVLPDDCPLEHRDGVYARLQDLGIEIGDSGEREDKSG